MGFYLKSATREPLAVDPHVAEVVSRILLDVERDGEAAVRRYSQQFDNWTPDRFTVSKREIGRGYEAVAPALREHIDIAASQIRRFAEAQRATLLDLEIETLPGLTLGHRHIPVDSVGAYSPGGRYPLIASSLMTSVVPR